MKSNILPIMLLLLIAYYGYMLLTPYSQDSVEGIVLAHQRGTYPQSLEESKQKAHIPLYGRLYYFLTEDTDATLLKGRSFSLISLVIIAGLLLLSMAEKQQRIPLLVLLLLQAPLLRFAVVNRVDLMAICCTISAFLLYRRWRDDITHLRMVPIILLLLCSFYLKQTAIIPLAMLIIYDQWRLKRYALLLRGVLLMSVMILIPMIHNPLLWIFMVESNVNTVNFVSWISLLVQVLPLLILCIIAHGNTPHSLIKQYGILALGFALLTSLKSGANINYFLESTFLLMLLLASSPQAFQKTFKVAIIVSVIGALPVFVRSFTALEACKKDVKLYATLEKDATVLAANCTPILIAKRSVAIVDLHITKQLWYSSIVDTVSLLEKAQHADYIHLETIDSTYVPLSIISQHKEISHGSL